MATLLRVTFVLAITFIWSSCKEHEHAGTAVDPQSRKAASAEHAGKEHAGKEQGGKTKTTYSAKNIKAAMNAHIKQRTQAGAGVFKINDPKTGKLLTLEFVKIHDPVRKIEGKGYFACTDFRPRGDSEGKLYDLDFWLNPVSGKLVITEEKIHKHPELVNKKWEKKARYTFINDEPVEVN